MSILKVGSKEVKKGIEYTGLVPYGNAIIVTDKDVLLSINRSPMTKPVIGEAILTLSSFTYAFDRDTTIWLTREVQDDYHIIWYSACPATVDLQQNTESATICEVTALEEVTVGKILCLANLFNDNNADENCTFKIYNGSTEIYSEAKVVIKKTTVQIAIEHPIITPLSVNDVISFTLTADKDMIVEGAVHPSQIQIERIS